MRSEKRPGWWRVWALLALPVILLFSLTIGLGVLLVFQAGGDRSVLSTTIPRLVVYVIILNHSILFALLLWFARLDGLKLAQIGFNRGRGWAPEIAIGLVFGTAIFFAQRHVFEPLLDLLLADTNTHRIASAENPLGTFLLPSLFAGIIAGGFVEEALFRGYALRRLTERMSLWIAIPIMLAFFAVLHIGLGLVGIVIATVNGLLFALLYIWRKSLIAPILAHGLVNAILLLL